VSFSATRHAWTIKVTTAKDMLVLLALAEHSDAQGECFPSTRRLAQMTKLSVRTVRRAILSLEKSGHISVERRKRNSMVQRSSVYRLSFVEILEVLDPLRATVSPGCGHSVTH